MDYFWEVHKMTIDLMPDSKGAKRFIVFWIAIDVVGLIGLSAIFLYRVFVASQFGATITGFTLLPIVYICVFLSILIWNV